MSRTPGRVPALMTFCAILLAVHLGAPALHGQVAEATRPAAGAVTQAGTIARLEAELARIAATYDGMIGVGAVDVVSGRAASLNGGEVFPMASSYKVPIAIELLTRVDRGTLRLDSMVALNAADVSPGSGSISQLFQVPGVALSVRNLLELMMLISDNSATDKVLELAGGGDAVTARMRALGYPRIRVDRSTLHLIADFVGAPVPAGARVAPAEYRQLTAAIDAEQRQRAGIAFATDPRDTSTPDDMARLLAALARGELLSQASTALLLDIMTRSTTGRDRILGMLPPGVTAAHKTGTIGGTTNDVGVMGLPNGGLVAIAVFVRDSQQPVATRERAIAHMARAVYDFFVLHADGTNY
jgi:beta-lactamase class A